MHEMKLAGAVCPVVRNRRMRNRTSVVWENGGGDPASYPILECVVALSAPRARGDLI